MAETARELPDFDLATGGGGRLRRADLAGHRTVLYFYPADGTSGCTLEGREFTDLLPGFRSAGVAVYGVSPDSAESHDRFSSDCDLGVPLISDPERRLIDFFQLWLPRVKDGQTRMRVQRSTFLIGPDWRVEREWREVEPQGHAADVLAAVRGGTTPA
jgi:peroxiredoxin Q/BCP